VLNVFVLLLFSPFVYDVLKADVLLLYVMLMILAVEVVDEADDENPLNEIGAVAYVHNLSIEFDVQHDDDILLQDL
jgi:hypothetical protein